MSLQIYKGKKVLLTGHTGFKGCWFMLMLNKIGADVYGLSLDADQDSLYSRIGGDAYCNSQIGDIRDPAVFQDIIHKVQPDFIFHLAAQSLVIDGYKDPLYTYQTNVIGTLNLLQAARDLNDCNIVVVTTDKVYENPETGDFFLEDDKLGGYDPYSSSKACAEILTASMCRSYFADNHKVKIVTARAGNVIGGGDFTANRLLPDIAKALEIDDTIVLRSPTATRPWQHVLDGLYGYLLLGSHIDQNDAFDLAWNFGPKEDEAITVEELTKIAIEKWGVGNYKIDDSSKLHEAAFLGLNSSQARQKLNWIPQMNSTQAVQWTIEWYKSVLGSEIDAFNKTQEQIDAYLNTV